MTSCLVRLSILSVMMVASVGCSSPSVDPGVHSGMDDASSRLDAGHPPADEDAADSTTPEVNDASVDARQGSHMDASSRGPDATAPIDATASDAAASTDAAPSMDSGASIDGTTDADVTDADAASPTEVAYVATYLGGLFAFAIDPATFAPSQVTGSPFDHGAAFYSLALHPSRPFLYAVDLNAGSIHGYRIGAGGVLARLDGSPYPNPGGPISIAIDAQGRFAYVANSTSNSISVFHVDADSGALDPVTDSPFAVTDTPAFVAADPAGRFLYVTQSDVAGIRVFGVDSGSGGLSEITDSPFAASLVFGRAVAIHSSGQFLFAGSLSAFTIDASTGGLTPVAGSPFATVGGSDPNAIDIALDQQGRYAYGIDTGEGTVSALEIELDSGSLKPVPGSPSDGGSSPYAVAVDPAGRFVYVGNDDTGQLSVLSVDTSKGSLQAIDGSPFSADGLQPQVVIATLP